MMQRRWKEHVAQPHCYVPLRQPGPEAANKTCFGHQEILSPGYGRERAANDSGQRFSLTKESWKSVGGLSKLAEAKRRGIQEQGAKRPCQKAGLLAARTAGQDAEM